MADKVITFTTPEPCACCGGQAQLCDLEGTVLGGNTGWIDVDSINDVNDSFYGSNANMLLAVNGDGTLWYLGTPPFEYSTTVVTDLTQYGTDTDWAAVAVGFSGVLGGFGFGICAVGIKTDGTMWVLRGWAPVMGIGVPPTGSVAPVTVLTQVGTATDWKQAAFYDIGLVAVNSTGGLYAILRAGSTPSTTLQNVSSTGAYIAKAGSAVNNYSNPQFTVLTTGGDIINYGGSLGQSTLMYGGGDAVSLGVHYTFFSSFTKADGTLYYLSWDGTTFAPVSVGFPGSDWLIAVDCLHKDWFINTSNALYDSRDGIGVAPAEVETFLGRSVLKVRGNGVIVI